MEWTVINGSRLDKRAIVLKILSTVFTGIMILVALLIVYAALFPSGKSIFGYRMFIVRTGSMRETICPGDLIIVRKTPQEQLNPDDVITFISNDPAIRGKANTHRITRIEGGLFYTKGDNNPDEDSYPVAYDDIIGRVFFVNAVFGKVIAFLSRPMNLLIFLLLPILLMSVLDVKKVVSVIRQMLRKDGEDEQPEFRPAEELNENEHESGNAVPWDDCQAADSDTKDCI